MTPGRREVIEPSIATPARRRVHVSDGRVERDFPNETRAA